MKKFLAMLLTLCMVLAFAGCAQKAPEATEAPAQEATTETPAEETPLLPRKMSNPKAL